MKRALKWALCILLTAAALTCFALGGLQLYNRFYVNLNGMSYPVGLEMLDLSGRELPNPQRLTRFPNLRQLDLRDTGATAEEYERIRVLLPNCQVLWELPFQDTYLPLSTRSIRVDRLTPEEISSLDYLPSLMRVEAWDCRDYEALMALQSHRPDCKVFYNVELSGSLYDCDTTHLSLKDTREPELVSKLRYLPKLAEVSFSGTLPEAAVLRELTAAYPSVDFHWEVSIGERLVDGFARELDLCREPQEHIVQLKELLDYFPQLERLYLGETDLPEAAILALEQGYPGLIIIWDMEILGRRFSRDAREVDLSGIPVRDLEALEVQLRLMPDLELVNMSDCGIPSREMDALNSRFPDTRFLWTVNLGGIRLRTDATWFCPNKYYITVDDGTLEDLQYLVDMVCIDIGHMRGVTHCRWAANMPKLKYLIIADTNIKDLSPLAGLRELVFLEAFTSPIRDYRPLLECPALEDLNLGYTYGDPTPVLEMTWLKRLWWPGSLRVLNWNVRNQLKINIPDAKMNFVAGSSTGEGWRSGRHYYDMRDLMGMPYMTG